MQVKTHTAGSQPLDSWWWNDSPSCGGPGDKQVLKNDQGKAWHSDFMFVSYLQIQFEQSLKEYGAAEWPAANCVISGQLRLYPLQGRSSCRLQHLYILSTISPSLTSPIITITCSVKTPSLLQSNYHQPLSLSLHNGYQETLRATVQELALDLQPPNWDNACALTVEGKNPGVCVCGGGGWKTVIF